MGSENSKTEHHHNANYADAFEVFYKISHGQNGHNAHAATQHNTDGQIEIHRKSSKEIKVQNGGALMDSNSCPTVQVDQQAPKNYHKIYEEENLIIKEDDDLKDEYPEWVIIELEIIQPCLANETSDHQVLQSHHQRLPHQQIPPARSPPVPSATCAPVHQEAVIEQTPQQTPPLTPLPLRSVSFCDIPDKVDRRDTPPYNHTPPDKDKLNGHNNSNNIDIVIDTNYLEHRSNSICNDTDSKDDGIPINGYSAHRKLSPAVSMESFMSGISTATNATYMPDMCDETIPSRIQTFLKYNLKTWTLTMGVKQAECVLSSKHQDKKVYWQIHLALLPHRTQRRKTKYKSTQTPIFNQDFDIPEVSKAALQQMAVRYRLYGRFGRVGRKKVVGEVEVGLGDLLHRVNNVIDGEWWTLKSTIGTSNRRMSNSSSVASFR